MKKSDRETMIEAQLVAEAIQMGGIAPKLALVNQAGWPDRTVILPGGRVAFIEVKKPNQKPTPVQDHWLKALRHLGYTAGVYDGSRPLSEILKELPDDQTDSQT